MIFYCKEFQNYNKLINRTKQKNNQKNNNNNKQKMKFKMLTNKGNLLKGPRNFYNNKNNNTDIYIHGKKILQNKKTKRQGWKKKIVYKGGLKNILSRQR